MNTFWISHQTKAMNSMNRLCLTIALMLAANSNLIADSLPGQLLRTAELIGSFLHEEEMDSVSLGEFSPVGDSRVDAFGPGLRIEMARALERYTRDNDRRVSIAENARVQLSGTYQVIDDPEDAAATSQGLPQQLVLKIEFKLVRGAERIFRHTAMVSRVRDIIKAEGIGGLLNLNDSTRDLHKTVRELRETPTYVLEGPRIRSFPHSPVSVEVRAKAVLNSGPAMPRIAELRDGIPFVPVGIGEVYEIIVRNASNEELAIALAIDGIDQFTFSDDRSQATGIPLFSHWIVRPGSTLPIIGWHKTASGRTVDNVRRFLVTTYGDGASQFVPHPDKSKVGVIHVAISRSHPQSDRGKARGDAETGFGPPAEVRQQVVRRTIDPPHEFIAIRYSH